MASLNFNAAEVQPNTPMDAIPAGEYKVEITESEMKKTAAGTGEYLQLTLKVVEGNFANRLLWERLNLVNPNPTATSIAQATLSQICHAVNRMNISDSSQLHGIPMLARVIVKDDPQYGAKNEVKSYKSAGVAQVPMGNPQPQTAPIGQPAAAPNQNTASPSSPPYSAPSQAGQGPAWNRPQ